MYEESLGQILYMSTASRQYSSQELLDMLVDFRARNEELGVSGLLLFHNQCFVQVIEGRRAPLQHLYGVIRVDPRHRRVITLLDVAVEEREFQDWSMGFVCEADFPVAEVPGFRDFFSPDHAETGSREAAPVLAIMRALRDQLRRLPEVN